MQLAPSLLSPAESFDVFYYLRNHTDLTTYYVRAVIYDVRSGEVLQTVNLTQATTNPHLYAKTVKAPADAYGYGRNIVAVATVYTDTGYTLKSQDYEEQEQYFLVKAIPLFTGGGGGVDYRVLREMMDEAILKGLDARPAPKQLAVADMPFSELSNELAALRREVGRVPKDKFDATTLTRKLDAIEAAIAAIPLPEPINFQPVLRAIATLPADIQAAMTEAKAAWAATGNTLTRDMEHAIDGMAAKIVKKAEAGLKDLMDRQQLNIPISTFAKGTPSTVDLSHLHA